jgi:cytochrome b subunit of formate dehydrogenase
MTLINLKIFPSVINALGLHCIIINMFWVYSAICIIICIVSALVLPDVRKGNFPSSSLNYKLKLTQPCTVIVLEKFCKGHFYVGVLYALVMHMPFEEFLKHYRAKKCAKR